MLPLLSPVQRRTHYIWHDLFLTDDAGPLSNGLASPGPVTRTLVQTDGQFSTASGKAVFTAQATPVAGDLRLTYDAVARASGLCLFGVVRVTHTSTGITLTFGFDNATTGEVDHIALRFSFGGFRIVTNGTARPALADAFVLNVDYECGDISGTTGGEILIRSGYAPSAVGNYPHWTRLYVDPTGSGATLYPALSSLDTPGTLADARLIQLPAPWDTDAGRRTDGLATTVADSMIVMLADALVEWTFTAQTGISKRLYFRYVDDNNCWFVEADQTNSKFFLYQRVAGVDTERGATGGLAQTWTNGTDYTVKVVTDHAVIKTYTPTVSNAVRHSYTSATFNQTATGVKVSHAGTNLFSHARYPTLPLWVSPPTRKLLTYGDSKTDGTGDATPITGIGGGFQPYLNNLLNGARSLRWYISKIARGGFTTAQMQALIDADIAAMTYTPDSVVYNLGANDTAGDATWITNTAYILDAMHTAWPTARIYVVDTYVDGSAVLNASLTAARATVCSTRSFCTILTFEATILSVPANRNDSKHYNNTGYQLEAAALYTVVTA